MTADSGGHTKLGSDREAAARTDAYDPFVRGRFPVGVRTFRARDSVRDRLFPCEIWYPAAARHEGQDVAPASQDVFTVPPADTPRSQMAVRDATARPGTYPLVVYCHPSGAHRRAATFLCTHLSSHGYVVAALDHSEVLAAELARKEGATAEEETRRIDAVIANRVPDVRFLLVSLFSGLVADLEARIDPTRIGIVGHSFGGWTALATPDLEPRIRAVVALAPGGASRRKPGIIPVTLNFSWGRDVPTLYLVAEDDQFLPIAGMHELFERTPATKRMVLLRRADHCHFMDHVEELHEALRTTLFEGELVWIPRDMRPIAELCSGEQAHIFVRGLALAHIDASLRRLDEAQQFWLRDLEAELAARGVDGMAHLS